MKIKRTLYFLYYKWIKRDCPHLCMFCSFKHRNCKEEILISNHKW